MLSIQSAIVTRAKRDASAPLESERDGFPETFFERDLARFRDLAKNA
jgi:hypothetical protein